MVWCYGTRVISSAIYDAEKHDILGGKCELSWDSSFFASVRLSGDFKIYGTTGMGCLFIKFLK